MDSRKKKYEGGNEKWKRRKEAGGHKYKPLFGPLNSCKNACIKDFPANSEIKYFIGKKFMSSRKNDGKTN
jgi:hypothetical protein